jgi:U3 small nucleolar RNA-associated protein 21
MSDACTWSYENKSITKLVLSLPDAKAAKLAATACAISACGNFALVGYSSGAVAKFNIQSGILRARFGGGGDQAAHADTVTALASDALNAVCVSGSKDKTVKVWGGRS